MKTIWRQWTLSKSGTGHGCIIKEFNGTKVKCTYECGNAYERFKIELFDGTKLNTVATMYDLGGVPDNGIYLYDGVKIVKRYDDLQINADTFIKTLLK